MKPLSIVFALLVCVSLARAADSDSRLQAGWDALNGMVKLLDNNDAILQQQSTNPAAARIAMRKADELRSHIATIKSEIAQHGVTDKAKEMIHELDFVPYCAATREAMGK